jgi:hypothetical protein
MFSNSFDQTTSTGPKLRWLVFAAFGLLIASFVYIQWLVTDGFTLGKMSDLDEGTNSILRSIEARGVETREDEKSFSSKSYVIVGVHYDRSRGKYMVSSLAFRNTKTDLVIELVEQFPSLVELRVPQLTSFEREQLQSKFPNTKVSDSLQ